MKTVKLISISDVKTEKARSDKKVSRDYYTATFGDASNPFADVRIRNVFQDHSADGKSAFWKKGNPSTVKQFVGKEIPGQIVNSQVKSYEIQGRKATSFTTVLLDGENLGTILRQAGHELATEVAAPVATESMNLND